MDLTLSLSLKTGSFQNHYPECSIQKHFNYEIFQFFFFTEIVTDPLTRHPLAISCGGGYMFAKNINASPNDIPDPAFEVIYACNTVICIAPHIIGEEHEWDFGDGNADVGSYVVHTYATQGQFNITHTATDNTGSAMHTETVDIDCMVSEECDCGTNGIDIVADAAGTDLSTLVAPNGPLPPNTLQNTCLSISGKLIVDQDYTISGGEIRMHPGSEIEVGNFDFALIDVNENGGIHGCTNMWKGITLRYTDGFEMYNTIVQDALFGVEVDGFIDWSLYDNIFLNNFVGIYSSPPGLGIPLNKISSIDNHPTRNHFICGGQLRPAYNGQSPDPIDFDWDCGHSGILLQSVQDFFIGNQSITDPENYFYGLKNGIMVIGGYTGTFRSYNSRMHNMRQTDDVFNNSNPPFTNLGAAGIYMQNVTFSRTERNVIDRAVRGIYALKSRIRARNNIISDVENGFEILENKGTRNIDIRGSDIFFSRNGILINNSHQVGSYILQNNTMHGRSESQYDVAYGIYSSDQGTNTKIKEISNNIIDMTNPGVGIFVGGGTEFRIQNNTITHHYDLPEPAAAFSGGIWAGGCQDMYLSGNSVSTSYGLAAKLQSYLINFSPNFQACCNTSDNANTGFRFSGLMDISHFRYNNIGALIDPGEHNRGIDCGYATEFGDQTHAGNTWNGDFNVFWAQHLGDFFNVANTQFQVEDSDFNTPSIQMDPPLWPQNPVSPNNANWFQYLGVAKK